MSRRAERVGEQLKREISGILRMQVHDPRVGGVTVTSVQVAPDLTFARVWVQLSGDAELRKRTLEGLMAAAPFVRRQLGSILHVRRIPELDFREDHTLAHALRIESLLREVDVPDEEPDSEAPGGEAGESEAATRREDPEEEPDA
jgi:ribosome-binding factor A